MYHTARDPAPVWAGLPGRSGEGPIVIDDPVVPPDPDPDVRPDVVEPLDEPMPPPIDLPPDRPMPPMP